jgi:ribosomal RNA-processing protein 9
VRLWQVKKSGGTNKVLEALGEIPVKGFVNALAIATSARFVVAGVGQEPRLGRWGKDKSARCGLLIQPLELQEE